jgi:hypothetical protein
MNKLLLFFAFTGISTFHHAQYCTTVGPSSTIDSNVELVQLTGESGGINFTGCPGVVGLQDLTSMNTILNAGSSYTISVKFGTCGGNYSGAGTVWIDFDQSGNFDASEAIGTWQGIPPVTTSVFNFMVPVGATNGFTRMRITQQEAGTLPLNPCASFTWGSVMDFGINIGNGVDCSGYIGDDEMDPVIVSSLPYSANGDNSYCYSNQNPVYNSPDVYYKLNPSPLMEQINVSLCGSSFDTFLTVVDGSGNLIAFNDDSESCGTSSEVSFSTAGLGVVYIIVEGWNTQMGEYSININADYLSVDEEDLSLPEFYPNPVVDKLNIPDGVEVIGLLDMNGKVMLNEISSKTDLTSIETGIYLLKFAYKGMLHTQRIVKL